MTSKLRGVIAAVATPINEDGSPDVARATKLARTLVDNGCDGLNVLGTTGEATSFSLDERKRVMSAYRDAKLPLDRMMVGTGAAAIADAVALTRYASELGFAGALVLPPFYYKGVPDDGLVAYIDTIVKATAQQPIPIYLYHYPQQSGLHWHVALVKRLLDTFGARIVGLKDSSGDIGGLTAAVSLLQAGFDVQVYEQSHLLSEVGAGINIGPNAARLLIQLGLGEECAKVAYRSPFFHQRRWDDGRTLTKTPLGEAIAKEFGAPHMIFHRGELHALLAKAVPTERVHLAHRCI